MYCGKPVQSEDMFHLTLHSVCLILSTVFALQQACATKIGVVNSCRFPINVAHTAVRRLNPGYKQGCFSVEQGKAMSLVDTTKYQKKKWEAGKVWATRQPW